MLTVEGLKSCYGRIEVLHGVDLEVAEGEIVTVVGANGAGKTTLLRCLSGIQPVSGGRVIFRGAPLTAAAHGRAALGLTQSPEGRQIFTNLSVEENLRLGAYSRSSRGVRSDMAESYAMFPILEEKRHLPAGGLSGGQQQMLAIARALMARPSCLLLDEPSMGLAPLLTKQIFDTLKTLRDRGMTILLVEQNARAALGLADRAYVMETGQVIISGMARNLLTDPRIRDAYLGT
ncbi:branched-chain amino acid transport system ATP-binding protein [Palleronia marisminoris]|uniref:High-affinity branched-chain amino acid transport ATP-binding protein LivF n=1 Tax=Palleronia marisminoris TaxID=315423 RepID=A0A1Y5RB24_9RHOB|nr:ABC transporter ATP-binding protein [Palleronia marisminoris]SFG10385.1 branched-chain amino acid transport system ATP-binding protein [Palleronia marisminoris]SLN13268.1 High-affinity branched-chain amino acid transport ATP-binding protein LivF [Palleronia marisminoris]